MPELTWNAPGLTWNQPGLTWDGMAPTTKTKKMKITLGLKELTEPELIAKARQLAASMLANAPIYGTSAPTGAQINTAADAAEAGLTAQATAAQAALAATTAKDALITTLETSLTKAASWAEDNVTTAANIELVFTLQKDRETTTSIAQVLALAATAGDNAGEVDLAWDPTAKAKSYEIQCRLATATDWAHAKISSSSQTTIAGLISGTLYHFRVRAIGPNGLEGAWSDLAEKRAA